MARPKNQAGRRVQLIAAATRAILERGSAGARLADIAEQAGLTSASVLYYYPDVRELFTAVLDQGSAAYCARREERVAEAATAADRLRACIRSGVPRPGPAEEASRVLYELVPIILRNPTAAEHNAAFVERQTRLYRTVLEEGSESGEFRLAAPAPVLARSFVALEDGYGMEVLTGAVAADEVESWLLLHARLVTGVELAPPGA